MASAAPTPLRTLQWVASILAVGWLLFLLRAVLGPVFAALLIAYMFDPLVDVLEARRIPRPLGIVLLLLAFTVGIAGFGLLAAPAVIRDFSELLSGLPAAVRELVHQVVVWLGTLGIDVPHDPSGLLRQLETRMTDLGPAALGSLDKAMSAAALGTASLLQTLGVLVMVPIFAFYFLADFDIIVARVRDLLPSRVRPTVVELCVEVDSVLSQFVRGQLLVMVILAALYAGGYALAGVPLSVPIGIIAGALAFIPYVGGAVALGLALLMVGLHFQGLGQLVAVLSVYAVIQVLEGFVITPKIVGDKLGLAPVWVLLALMAFGELFGFMGVMLALPMAAVIKVLIGHLLRRYRNSGLLQSSPPLPAQRVPLRRYRPRRRRRGAG